MGENILKLMKPADMITLVSAILGFVSVTMIIRGQLENALVLILIAVIADGADGAVARYYGTGVLGANLDSLADVISFGIAPAAAAFVFLNNWVLGISASFFLICGVLRLARFNVSGKKDGFEGIPITSGGFVVALFLLMKDYVPYLEHILVFLLVVLSLLMVSTIEYPKLKNPVILASMGLLLVMDIAVFYLGYHNVVKIASLILFISTVVYMLSPVARRFYGSN